jgi:tetraacyldisaccharide 4'-kinase
MPLLQYRASTLKTNEVIREYLVKVLLSPFSLLYGLGVSIRNLLYQKGVLRPARFDIPIISVGNLSIGGTGKSPHIEYLVRWLKEYMPVAILSRGYKRESTGFQLGQQFPSVKIIGDEPYQFLSKFPDVPIAVSENRELGIPYLLKSYPDTRLVLLDDAFQHLSVKPYINILLTSYEAPFTRDYLLPSGRLREWRSSYTRADIIIVTKCPPGLISTEASTLLKEINLASHQSIFFTEYNYQLPYYIFNPRYRINWNKEMYVLLLSGIANTDYLELYLKDRVAHVQLLSFADHHWYSNFDLGQIKRQFDELPGPNKLILTTEKDASRLSLHRGYLIENKIPMFVLPVEVNFLWNEEQRFKDTIAQKLIEFKS